MSKVLQVVLFPNEVLRKKAQPVTNFDADLAKLADDMATTMYHYRGIGLAANQVSVLQRIFVLDVTWREESEDEKEIKKKPLFFVNPEIASTHGDTEHEEGCLSFPKMYGIVPRSEKILVRFQDLKGKHHEEELSELKAIAFQHELDHLNGIMFFDHLSLFKRRTLIEKYTKQQAELKKEKEES